MDTVTLIHIGTPNPRLAPLLPCAPTLSALPATFQHQRFLLVVSLDDQGLCQGLYPLLSTLRANPQGLEGCVAGLVVDGGNPLYTKAVAQDLALSANLAGCTLVGKPLVEGVGALENLQTQANNGHCTLTQAYEQAIAQLLHRIATFAPKLSPSPHLVVLHASTYGPSNTMDLWSVVQHHLPADYGVTEIGLRNGAVSDCAGCPYTTCLHFGEAGRCFYGGVMVDDVYPALRKATAVLMLCPNYNDALSANLTACINRLTSLYRTYDFTQKAIYALVVSGYSGGDILAKQVISAFAMNKGFYLPPHFCRFETALQPGEALTLPGVKQRMASFADTIAKGGSYDLFR